MRYQVPQFIEIEDKIFGPLTFKQFIYVGGSVGISFLIWKTMPPIIALFFIMPVGGFGFALAFYKVNNRPFVNAMENGIKFFFSDKLYLWQKKQKKVKRKKEEEGREEINFIPKLSDSRLKDLSWSLDIQDSLYAGVTPGVKKASIKAKDAMLRRKLNS